MIVDTITVEFDAFEWWYAFALSLAFSAAIAGLFYAGFLLLRTRSWTAALAPALLGVASAVAAGITAFAGVDWSPVAFLSIQVNQFASNVLSAIVLGLALTLGAAAAIAIAILAFRPAREAPRGFVLRALVPALLVVLGVAVTLGSLKALTEDRVSGSHPAGTLLGGDHPSVHLAQGLAFPTGIAVSPSGDVFFTEMTSGRIGTVTSGPQNEWAEVEWLATVPLPEDGKLFHIALHPEWPRLRYLYVTAEQEADNIRYLGLVRVRMTGDGPPELQPLIEGLPIEQPLNNDHYGSAIAFCAGYLFLSIGDTDGVGPRQTGNRRFAQVPNMAVGKILRYRLDGIDLVPAGVINDDPPVFAMGFRNVFGMGCDPETGLPVVVDNGPIGHDQVRVVEPGTNHEWPYSAERNQLSSPVFDSGHTPLGPTGVVARERDGRREILFSAFHSASVYRLRLDPDSDEMPRPELFHATPTAALALAEDQTGCVYVADVTSIWRITDDRCPSTEVAPMDETAHASSIGDMPVSAFYSANCAPCHGVDRAGIVDLGPSLLELDGSDDSYFNTIANGREGTPMPSWRAAGLSDAEIRAIVAWLRTAQPE
jgi:glucose/arabinose dehydrogenase